MESLPTELNEGSPAASEKVSLPRKLWKWTVKIVCGITIALLGYLLCAVVGLLPVNGDFKETKDGVTILVYSGPVHSDIIVPASNHIIDWREHFPAKHFRVGNRGFRHVAIGWGDRGFFLHTPTWEDLKVSVAANAILIPSGTVMQVQMRNASESSECRAVTISDEQYRRLVEFMLTSFERKDGKLQPIARPPAYPDFVAFYEANGSYHAFNTCNCWVARGLKHAGVKTPWFSPLPRTVLWYLPE